ncbi:ABC transporter ATP-binding protein [Methylococcus geothermalis]|nr:ATP-binding cassette domain-containing protein [Methylococcus geothermalis]
MLELSGVERRRGEGERAFTLAVEGLSLRKGECLAVTGPSGSGKSTLLDLLGLVLRPDRADAFRFLDQDVAALWRSGGDGGLAALRSRHLGYVLQTGGLLPFLNLRENVELSRRLLGLGPDALTGELLARLGLTHLKAEKPRALSVGERQRAAIARAFAHRPALVLADEPTAALDPPQALEVCRLMLELAAEFGIALVVVSHDWELVRKLALPQARVVPDAGSGACRSRLEWPADA